MLLFFLFLSFRSAFISLSSLSSLCSFHWIVVVMQGIRYTKPKCWYCYQNNKNIGYVHVETLTLFPFRLSNNLCCRSVLSIFFDWLSSMFFGLAFSSSSLLLTDITFIFSLSLFRFFIFVFVFSSNDQHDFSFGCNSNSDASLFLHRYCIYIRFRSLVFFV